MLIKTSQCQEHEFRTLLTQTTFLWSSHCQGFQVIDFPATQSSVHIKTRILYKKVVHDGQEVWEVIHSLFTSRAIVHISMPETRWSSCSESLFQSVLDFSESLDPRTA